MGRNVTIAVIDDQDVVLSGVRGWIAEDPRGIEIVHTASGPDGLEDGPGTDADVLVVDLRIAGELIFDRIAELSAAGHRIVVFSQYAEPDLVRRAEEAGARAFITKESNEGQRHLIEAVLAVHAGETYTTPSQAGVMLAEAEEQRPKFSEQELRTMRLWLGGLTRAAVARQMGISEYTVKQYLERAREKYSRAGREAPTRVDLYREARRDGIVLE
ncbi:response regulator [Actinomadura sp. 1N219]|uniref:response regulator transcription factor n=1 Tax=Actinomadura sp. 1N219 TaxID=3375152 RepID=UPI00379CFCC4